MAHNNDGGRVHPRDAGRRETDAELWATIDEQRQSMGRLEAMVQRLLEQQPNPLSVNLLAPGEEDANGRPGGRRPHRVARNRQPEELMEEMYARSSNYKKDMGESSYTMANRGRFTPGEVQTPFKSVADQAQRSVVPNNNHAGTRPATVAKEAPRSVNFVDAGENGEEKQYVEEGVEVEELLDRAEIAEE
ncbi:Hypothetical predicted protein [Olea europaea subsp. europaea]|uniref:Uncharacterized protein n=1 Tax=Olea europaea subsp. europaea TaxID=158383 RepID=A0A8S0VES5_OLEEU|nr:Hypothetical predicted protein [Olea europaea subsp. europaea]